VLFRSGTERTFLEDGDEVVITGWATRRDGSRIPLGEVSGRIVPAVATGG
jgi:fumarylacetoacetase